MIRYATNPPGHKTAHEEDSSLTSPHLYQRPRSTSIAHKIATTSSPIAYIRNSIAGAYHRLNPRLHHRRHTRGPYRWGSFTNFIRAFWILLVIWGERWVWASAFSACAWENWEKWPTGATPHRMALIADPQLVDIHTYQRRGLSLAATIYYADKYLARAWSALHTELLPVETVFLGDLFDGGREWAVEGAFLSDGERGIRRDPNEKSDWKKHGNAYWLQEFARWESIFPTPAGRISRRGMPGNHDLGFGGGVKQSVRGRFRAFFGEGNVKWQAGNHTFVMVDSVSLSNEIDEAIYGPAREFLKSLETAASRPPLWPHTVRSASEQQEPAPHVHNAKHTSPTVLFTHVPLFREKGTPCGALRERGTSIPIWQGYQYQNVLTPQLSAEVLQQTRARYVFSGDDHDACDVTHMYGPQGRVREWTVKSIGWTMGIRRPAFEMVSLWNPGTAPSVPPPPPLDGLPAKVPETPEQLTARLGPPEERDENHVAPQPPLVQGGEETLQAHLCFLPDQIGVFLTYAFWLAVTLAVTCVEVWWTRAQRREAAQGGGAGQVLPVWKGIADEEGKYWKPRPKRELGRFWWVWEIACEMGSAATVALAFYGIVLWRW